jgi:pimeloyl-ACP methyl ester carboxylesterase
MLRTLGAIMVVGLASYLAACLWMFVAQRSFIYFPPDSALLAAPHTSTLVVPGALVKVSERPLPGKQAVIYLGGNAEDVSASLPLLDRAFPDHALYLLHYRGYPGSSGTPTEAALVADALTLFDRVAAEHSDVVVIGRSLGAGVAIQVASRRQARKLVLVTPFDSLQDLAAQQFPYFPVRWLLKDKYESWRYVPQVKAPTLILAAENDEIIPAWSTERLVSRFAQGSVALKVVGGAGHNSISESPSYPSLLRN